jgi:hypothetical protein
MVSHMHRDEVLEAVMIRVRLEYDAYNRRFNLIDREFGSILQDGEVYELTLPLKVERPDGDEALISVDLGPFDHL